MSILTKCEDYTVARDSIASGMYPYFHVLESMQAATVTMEGKRRIMLGSNNYLSLTSHPDVINAGVDALYKYGTGCSGSRFLNGTLDLHIELEARLAAFVSKPACMTFPTGFQSNLGIISAIVQRGDYVIIDREDHASIYDGCKLSGGEMVRYRHGDLEDLERKLAELPEKAGKLIVIDGVFSMSGDICDLPGIVAIAKKYGAATMVDDAHGFGVLGRGGRGTAEHFGLTADVDIIMSTFSKSLASIGGFMAGDALVVDYVRHNSRPFIFSASITPASCAVALAALDVLERNPELPARLGRMADYFRLGLRKRGIAIKDSNTPIIPIYIYDMNSPLVAARELFEQGVYVNPVLPPATPASECLLRASIMASHTEDILDEAMDTISRVVKQYARA